MSRREEKPLIERQADRFAASLMMPAEIIQGSQAVAKIVDRHHHYQKQSNSLREFKKNVASRMSLCQRL